MVLPKAERTCNGYAQARRTFQHGHNPTHMVVRNTWHAIAWRLPRSCPSRKARASRGPRAWASLSRAEQRPRPMHVREHPSSLTHAACHVGGGGCVFLVDVIGHGASPRREPLAVLPTDRARAQRSTHRPWTTTTTTARWRYLERSQPSGSRPRPRLREASEPLLWETQVSCPERFTQAWLGF